MVLYTDSVTLIDRNVQARTVKTGTDGVPNGDLTPWRIRLELVNTAEDGVDNSGILKLRIDENKTFIKTGPLFMQEDAKTKYLIECKISQDIGGSSVDSKYFMFQIGTPSISVDKDQGAIMTINLQEIQRRTQEVFTSRELRFVSPEQAVILGRLPDFLNYEGSFDNPVGNRPVQINFTSSDTIIPKSPELEYVPVTPITIKKSLDIIFNGLAESSSGGGVFTDYYYDYDPAVDPARDGQVSGHPLRTYLIANKIGAIDSGAVIDPLSADPIDAEQMQDANTNFFRYRNHVIGRGNTQSGSLPTNHSTFSSNWLHAKIRDEWNSLGGNNGAQFTVGGDNFYYLKGMTVKKTYTLNSFTSTDPLNIRQRTVPLQRVVRFFQAVNDVTVTTDPVINHTDWQEDFIIYPEFDRTGHYTAGDVVYFNTGGTNYRFYQATEDIYDWSLNRYRYWADPSGGNGTYPVNTLEGSGFSTKHLSNINGFLFNPDQANSGFSSVSLDVPDHTAITYISDDEDINGESSFIGWEGFSPWTSDVFDWEQNMAGLGSITSGVLPYGATAGRKNNDSGLFTSNRYVGLIPDWNLTKDVYDKQDVTDQYENISMKWVDRISNTPPTSAETYHGQRIMVGPSPSNGSAFDPLSNNEHANQLAQYFYNQEKPSDSEWKFSKSPEEGDVFNNLDDGKVYQWNSGSGAYEVQWKISKDAGSDKNVQFNSIATPFHLCKDVYKTKGFEGTPNSAIEFRFAWDSKNFNHLYNTNKEGGHRQATQKNKVLDPDKESVEARANSRGAWIWFWLPFPRNAHSDNNTVAIGDKYGGNGDSPLPRSGFTTLNIFNNSSDRNQSTKGWNNGLNSEDMGKISSISFRIKTGIYALESDESNDDYFWEIPQYYAVIGEANIPMTFWCVDIFDRIWTHKFTVRKNGFWDEITIPVGDFSRKNLHIPRFDELVFAFGRPLNFTNFFQPEREYTGVSFDWRFVKGWGIQLDGAYDPENGYYNGGLDNWIDNITQLGETLKQAPFNIKAKISDALGDGDVDSTFINNLHPMAWAWHNQATIALDDVRFDKELVVNSDKSFVNNARTEVINLGNVSDRITLKNMVKSRKARLSFYPQFWTIRSIGDVRLRVGQSFKIKGDRMPNTTDMDGVTVWSSLTTYSRGDKVSFGDFVYQSLQNSNTNEDPSTETAWWENMNELSVSEVRHIIDHSGYHCNIQARRKFILTGET